MAKKNNRSNAGEGAEILEELDKVIKEEEVNVEKEGVTVTEDSIENALESILAGNVAEDTKASEVKDVIEEVATSPDGILVEVKEDEDDEEEECTGAVMESDDEIIGTSFGAGLETADDIVTCTIDADKEVTIEEMAEVTAIVETAKNSPEFKDVILKENTTNIKGEMTMVPMKKVSIKGYVSILEVVKMIIGTRATDNVVFESRPLTDLIRASSKGDAAMEAYLFSHVYMAGADGKLIMPFALQLELNASEYGMAPKAIGGAIESVVLDTQLNEKLLEKRYGDYIMRDAQNDIITLAEPKGDKIYVVLSFENVLNAVVLFNAEKEGLDVNNIRYVTNIQQNASNVSSSKIVFEIFEEEATNLFR